MGKFRSIAAVGALASMASLSGCWWQAGAGPGKGGFNGSETTVTAANVAGLAHSWTIDVGGVPREPLVSGGTTYVRTTDSVTARRLSDGGQVWTTAVAGSTMPVIVENALRVPSGGASCTITTLALNNGSNQGTRGYGFYGIFVPSPTFSGCSTVDPVAVGTKVVTTAASFIQTIAPHCGIVAASSDGVSYLDYAASPQNAETGQNYVGPCGGGAPPSPVPPEAPTAVSDFIIRPHAASGDARAYPVGCTPGCPAAWVVDTAAAWIGPVVALPNGDFAVAAADNTVVVVDGTTHALDWTGTAGAPLAQPVAADGTNIYALTTDGHLTVLLVVGVVAQHALPQVRPEDTKNEVDHPAHSEWGPVFRVDLTGPLPPEGKRMLVHDGSYGSGIWAWDGDVASLTRYEDDSRRIPFGVLGGAPGRELIIGSAGGNEILASLYYKAKNIEAVELNPVTVSLLRGEFADLTGHLADRPEVDLHVGDGRSYLARSDGDFDLVWYVAPDSYAATNAASSGAFVLSESYLYTSEMIEETLRHLSKDGIMVVQFGELDIDQPSRTARYLVTARQALHDLGIDDPARHLAVSAQVTPGLGSLSTIVVKRSALTSSEVDGFTSTLADMSSEHRPIYAPGGPSDGSVLAGLAGGSDASVDRLVADFPRDISAVSDDAPFFWHFTRFGDVLAHIAEPIDVFVADPEQAIGERVLLLLLALSALYAAAFLLVPFLLVRRVRSSWAALPAKRTSALYFACLGLGFMFYEVTMIQRLVRFLGYPTYSLTVTLAAILISTGCGALLSRRLGAGAGGRVVVPRLLGALALLTGFYQFGLDPLEDALQGQGLAVRVALAVVVLAPLGLCLGMFMPLGLGVVARFGGEDYVAWSWAVNGFFSVIGSVLTTILSMALGFTMVQYLALLAYAGAVLTFRQLHRRLDSMAEVEPAATSESVAPELVGAATG